MGPGIVKPAQFNLGRRQVVVEYGGGKGRGAAGRPLQSLLCDAGSDFRLPRLQIEAGQSDQGGGKRVVLMAGFRAGFCFGKIRLRGTELHFDHGTGTCVVPVHGLSPEVARLLSAERDVPEGRTGFDIPLVLIEGHGVRCKNFDFGIFEGEQAYG